MPTTTDLTNCDREPIHIPGRIQSHGVLIIVDKEYLIRYHSDNLTSIFTGQQGTLFDRPISIVERYFGNGYLPGSLQRHVMAAEKNTTDLQIEPYTATINATAYNIIISPIEGHYLFELEPTFVNAINDSKRILNLSINLLIAKRPLQDLLDKAAQQVRNILNYDRVMIYRFAEDGHGEVVAENKNEHLKPWLGLHYPASDIPRQARELYKLNLTRLIADVGAPTSVILTSSQQQQQPDLTFSQLRAVSPIHIEYLQNMGVASSFSISIIHKDELWGLIACHNYTPKFIDYELRESCKLIGQLLSTSLAHIQEEDRHSKHEALNSNLESLLRSVQLIDSIPDALTKQAATLLDIVEANGAVLFYEREMIKLGKVPADDQLVKLNQWINDRGKDISYRTSDLQNEYAAGAAFKDIGSGILYTVISKELNEGIIWFKQEQLQMIRWAGQPLKNVRYIDGKKHISPRNSFKEWSQQVTGSSTKWSDTEINNALKLREAILYAITLKAGAIRVLNEKLREAYDELDTFSYTISHDLKNPITAIKGLTQLIQKNMAMPLEASDMLSIIEKRTDKMNNMLDAILQHSQIARAGIVKQRIDMQQLLSDIIADAKLGKQDVEIGLEDTPDIYGEPVMIAQAFENLIGNAVKYSSQKAKGIINIKGIQEPGQVIYIISDNGIGIRPGGMDTIFDLFSRMDNVGEIKGTGIGLAIVKKIVEKHHGKIIVESELNKGSSFSIYFPRGNF